MKWSATNPFRLAIPLLLGLSPGMGALAQSVGPEFFGSDMAASAIISQADSLAPSRRSEASFCSICREDLGLHSGDIAAFARTFDLELSPARAAEPEENTGGWLCSTA